MNLCSPSEVSASESTVTFKVTTGDRVTWGKHYPDIIIKRLGSSANRLVLDHGMSERQFEIFRVVDGAKSLVATSGVVGPAL